MAIFHVYSNRVLIDIVHVNDANPSTCQSIKEHLVEQDEYPPDIQVIKLPEEKENEHEQN